MGARSDNSPVGSRVALAPYLRLDGDASYKLTDLVSPFARLENIADALWQEAVDFSTPGRSIYGGLNYPGEDERRQRPCA